jgi:hypothetical protein
MACVSVTNVSVLDNPARFEAPFQFEVSFECLAPIEDDIEWKLNYVGSAETAQHDQLLDSVLVGPMKARGASRTAPWRVPHSPALVSQVGGYKIVFQADPPDPRKIPAHGPRICGYLLLGRLRADGALFVRALDRFARCHRHSPLVLLSGARVHSGMEAPATHPPTLLTVVAALTCALRRTSAGRVLRLDRIRLRGAQHAAAGGASARGCCVSLRALRWRPCHSCPGAVVQPPHAQHLSRVTTRHQASMLARHRRRTRAPRVELTQCASLTAGIKSIGRIMEVSQVRSASRRALERCRITTSVDVVSLSNVFDLAGSACTVSACSSAAENRLWCVLSV